MLELGKKFNVIIPPRLKKCNAFLPIKGKINPEKPNNKNKHLPLKEYMFFKEKQDLCWSRELFSAELWIDGQSLI